MVEDYVMDLKHKISPNTIPTRIYPLQAFFEINDIDLKWSKIRRLFPAKVKKSGRKAYTTEQVQEMLKFCPDLRNRAIILFMAASGCRVGALPYLKIKDIKNIEDCKHVVIYSGEIEEYSSFLTPEAAKSFDLYLEKRKKDGEYLDDESPAFRKTYRLGIEKAKPVTNRTISEMMQRLLKTSRLRSNKNGSRYETQLDHGLRKRFDTIMKQTDSMKLIHAEKMFGHSIPSIPLDETYADFSVDSLFKEYKKAIPDLTIDGTLRNEAELEAVKSQVSDLEKTKSENKTLQKQMSEMETNFQRQIDSILDRLPRDS
jgi:integrase/recombinase XerD